MQPQRCTGRGGPARPTTRRLTSGAWVRSSTSCSVASTPSMGGACPRTSRWGAFPASLGKSGITSLACSCDRVAGRRSPTATLHWMRAGPRSPCTRTSASWWSHRRWGSRRKAWATPCCSSPRSTTWLISPGQEPSGPVASPHPSASRSWGSCSRAASSRKSRPCPRRARAWSVRSRAGPEPSWTASSSSSAAAAWRDTVRSAAAGRGHALWASTSTSSSSCRSTARPSWVPRWSSSPPWAMR
mmetsp:Transcript_13471/g.40172  ORF Transcript_13471/g.40172 Transcript_13471/m.40172 type:complete len:243 (-) Transcript_13471:397-1125(-)